MPIQAVVFDIGGVLEINEPGLLARIWEPKLGLSPGELGHQLRQAGLRAVLFQDTGQAIADIQALLNGAD